jgi:hypothetical protein
MDAGIPMITTTLSALYLLALILRLATLWRR